MPTNRTLRPDNMVSSFGWANASTVYDNNTASYMQGSGNNLTATFSLADLVITPEMSILAITMNIMWEVAAIAEAGFYVELSNSSEGWTITKKLEDYSTSAGYTTQIDLVALRQSAPAGKRTWTPSSWNGTQLRLYTTANANQVNVREVWFTMQTNDQPKVSAAGPNAIVSTLRPQFQFNITDADGDTISKYRMLVINLVELQRVQQNLSDSSLVAEFDSGEVAYNGPAGTIAILPTSDLRSGQAYRAFLMAWDSAGVQNKTTYTNTVYAYANIEVPVLATPRPPAISPDNTNGKMDITLQADDNLLTFNASGAELNSTADVGQSLNGGGVTVSTANPIEGNYAFRTTHSGAGDMDMLFQGTTIPVGLLSKVSGQLSTRYLTNRRSFQVGIAFYDAAGGYLSTVLGALQFLQQNANAWTIGYINDVAVPALAAKATLVGHIIGGAASEAHEWDALTIQPRRFINMVRSPQLNRNPFNGTGIARGLNSYNASGTAPTYDIVALPDGLVPEGTGQKINNPGGSVDKGLYALVDVINGRKYTMSWWVYSTVATSVKVSYGFSSVPGGLLTTVAVPANTWTLVQGTYTWSSATGYMTVFVAFNNAAAATQYATMLQVVDTTGLSLSDYDPTTTYLPNGWSRGGGLSVQRLTLQRRVKDTTTWYTVKTFVTGYGNDVRLEDIDINDATQQAIVADYFAQPGSIYEYRTRVTGTDSGGLSISSPWSVVSVPATLTKLKKAWLKSPSDPTKNVLVTLQTWRIEKTIQKQRTEKMPIGRKHPVIVSGTRRSEKFGWSSLCLEAVGDGPKLKALLDRDEALILQMPKKQSLVNIDGDYNEVEWEKSGDPDDIILSGTFQEVSGMSKL